MIFLQYHFIIALQRRSGFLGFSMRNLSQIPTVLSLLLAIFLSSTASAQSPIEQIAKLNAAGQAQAAYELSMQLLPEYEGEPAFDLHYGVAAIDYGKVSEGAFALERVLMNEPNNDYARLELGRAYFALEEDGRAESEFNRVLAANPPEEVTENIQNYLRAINARKYKREPTWTANLMLRSGYDTNVNASADDIDLGNNLTLLNTSESSAFVQYKADATYMRPIVYGTTGFVSGYLSKNDNLDPEILDADDNDIDLDIFSYGVKLGLSQERGANNLRLVLQADTLELDSDDFRDSLGVNASWTHSLSKQRSITTYGLISQNSFTSERSFRDSTLALIGASYRHRYATSYSPLLSIGFNIGKDDADEDNFGARTNTQRDMLGLNALLSLALRDDLRLDTGLSMQKSDYQDPQPIIFSSTVQESREDTRYSLNLGLSWFAKDNLVVKLDGSVGKTDSNILVWEHSRNQIAASIQYTYR